MTRRLPKTIQRGMTARAAYSQRASAAGAVVLAAAADEQLKGGIVPGRAGRKGGDCGLSGGQRAVSVAVTEPASEASRGLSQWRAAGGL